jgi:hypothetical protein
MTGGSRLTIAELPESTKTVGLCGHVVTGAQFWVRRLVRVNTNCRGVSAAATVRRRARPTGAPMVAAAMQRPGVVEDAKFVTTNACGGPATPPVTSATSSAGALLLSQATSPETPKKNSASSVHGGSVACGACATMLDVTKRARQPPLPRPSACMPKRLRVHRHAPAPVVFGAHVLHAGAAEPKVQPSRLASRPSPAYFGTKINKYNL